MKPVHEGTSASARKDLSPDGVGEDGGIQPDLGELMPVDHHDGDPDAVFELQGIEAGDVDLLEVEGGPGPFGQDDFPGLVAQATAGPRLHKDRSTHLRGS